MMLPALLWAVGLADNPSDANIIGHVVDATTGEHLSHYNIVLKGTRIHRNRCQRTLRTPPP